MDLMKKNHSQVRYLTVLIIDELFMCLKLFRLLLVINFDQFLSLSVGFRRNMPLPPPASVASMLRSKSIELLEKWNGSFGIYYRQLRLGFDYLKNTLGYKFPNRLENAARIQQERRDREMRSKQILLNEFENLKENYSSVKAEIQSTIDEIEQCLEIVNVEEEDFTPYVSAEEEGTEEFISLSLQQIRLDSIKEGEKIQETSDNKAAFDALRKLHKLLTSKHLPAVQEWISVLIRVDLTDNKFRDSALKEFIDLRNVIQSVKKSCSQLDIDDNVIDQLAKEAVKNVRERERETKSQKRAKLAKVREPNESVLREAAIASISYSEAFVENTESPVWSGRDVKGKKVTLASMLKKKVTMNTRARDNSSRQVTQREDSKYREAFPNQW